MNNTNRVTLGVNSNSNYNLGTLENKQKNYNLMKIELEKLNMEFLNFSDQLFKLNDYNQNLNQLSVIYSSMFMSTQKLEKSKNEETEEEGNNN